MKLIFIYGPPAVGKLTVAEELSKLSNIAVFHNHLTRDLVKDIYGDKLADHYDLVTSIREEVLAYCAKNDTDIIFTYVYAGADDDKNVTSLHEAITSNDGEVVFIELTANREDLLQRVVSDSRMRFKKLVDPAILEKLTEEMEKFSIPFVEKTVINTSELSAEEAAQKINSLISPRH